LQAADFWYGKTALEDLLGVPADKVYDQRLYRALDALLPMKDELFRHLQQTYGEMFGTTFDLLLYDRTLFGLGESAIRPTSLRPTLRGRARRIPRPGAAIRATRGPIAYRFALAWWLRPRACRWRTRSLTATGPM